MIVFPSVVFAGDASWNAKATFYNQARFTKPGLPSAKGTATITYNQVDTWTISVNITGLLKSHDYIFNISLEDQQMVRANYPLKSDSKGKLITTFTTTEVVTRLNQTTYSIIRLLDMSGESGGMLLTELQPTDNPYSGDVNATMVMRAREDGLYGSLVFTPPK